MNLAYQEILGVPTDQGIIDAVAKVTKHFIDNLSQVLLIHEDRKGTLSFELIPREYGMLEIYGQFSDGYDLGELSDQFNEAFRERNYGIARELYVKSLKNPL